MYSKHYRIHISNLVLIKKGDDKMIEALTEAFKSYVKVAPHVNKIKENKLRVYELSKDLSKEQGLELIEIFDSSIEEMKKMQEKIHERKDRKDD